MYYFKIARLLTFILIFGMTLPLLSGLNVALAQGSAPITPQNAGQIVQLARFGRGWLLDAAWTPDGGSLVLGGSVGVWVYDADDVDAAPMLITGHTEAVRAVAVSPDGSLIASGSDDDSVKLWNAASGAAIATLSSETYRLSDTYGLAFSPDGGLIASGGSSYRVYLWDTTGAEAAVLESATSTVNALVFSPDGGLLAAASEDGNVYLWDTGLNEVVGTLAPGDGSRPKDAAFSPDGLTLVAGYSNGKVRFWNIADGSERAVYENGDVRNVRAVAFHPQGSIVAAADDRSGIRLLDPASGTETGLLQGHAANVISLAYRPDGSLLMSVSEDETVRLWDASGTQTAVVPGHTNRAMSAAFNPQGTLIIAGYTDDQARLWSPASNDVDTVFTGEGHQNIDGNITTTTFNHDGSLVATADGFGVFIRDGATGAQLHYLDDPDTGLINSFAFNPDSSVIAIATWDGPVTLWDVAAGQRLASLIGHTDDTNSVAFSPDGSLILTASADGTVRLWGLPGGISGAAAPPGSQETSGEVAAESESGAAAAPPSGETAGSADTATSQAVVDRVRIELDQRITNNWNEIDAVELVGLGPDGAEIRQWASGATASTEYGPDSWSAQQATGAPNTTACGDQVLAWASASANGQDTLDLTYTTPVIPTGINIHQNYNPGAIVRVQAFFVGMDVGVTFFEGVDTSTPCPGVLSLSLVNAGSTAAPASSAPGASTSEAAPIVYGDLVTGAISADAFAQQYTFQAATGDVVTITMIAIDGTLDAYLRLINPSGTEVAFNDDAAAQVGSSGFNAQIAEFTIPTDGVYTIVATRFGQATGSSAGSYTLEIANTAK